MKGYLRDTTLPKDGLTAKNMVAVALRLGKEDEFRIKLLAMNPRATTTLWLTIVRRGAWGIRVLLECPRALEQEVVRQNIMAAAEKQFQKSRNVDTRMPSYEELVMAFPEDAINEPLARLARQSPGSCLDVIESLPQAKRSHVDLSLLTDMIESSPDGLIRKRAILLLDSVGPREDSAQHMSVKAPAETEAPRSRQH